MRLFASLVFALLAGCVVVPRTVDVYDAQCRLTVRQMTLDVDQLGGFVGCANEGCVALLAAAGVVTAASAVVSGSIVVAGNFVYWLEKRGKCDRDPERAVPPTVSPMAPASEAMPAQ